LGRGLQIEDTSAVNPNRHKVDNKTKKHKKIKKRALEQKEKEAKPQRRDREQI
jgi:hypothetical protein